MKARDVMSVNLVSVRPQDRVHEAARKMAENDRASLPVIDEQNRVIGLITELDLLKLLLPDYMRRFEELGFLPDDFQPGAHSFEDVACVLVGQAMRPDSVQTVSEDEPVLEVVRVMTQHCLQEAPVVRDGKLVGMLSSSDLIRRLIHVSLESCD